MYEIDRLTPEFQPATPAQNTLELVDALNNPTTIGKFQDGLNNELEDTAMQHVVQLENRVTALRDELIAKDGDAPAQLDLDDQINHIRSTQQKTFGAQYARFQDIQAMKRDMANADNNKLCIYGAGAREMAEFFTSKAETIDPAEQQFVDGEYLKALADDSFLTTHIRDDESPIEIPLSSIVSAEGFESWEGRGSQESSDKIADFASRDTDIPPIAELYAYVLPDGKVLYKTANSHRVAAAIKKGQTTIGFKGSLSVSKLRSVPHSLETEGGDQAKMIESTTMNGNTIHNPREKMGLEEFQSMVEQWGIKGRTPAERAESLKKLDADSLALMLGDMNRRIQGSEDTLVDDKVVKIGDNETISPEQRYDVFVDLIGQIKDADNDVSPERLGDTLALGLVLLHPFKDGNGRTARLVGSIFRDAYDDPAEMASDYDVLVQSRDELRKSGAFVVNGYIPQGIDNSEQSNPDVVSEYFSRLLSEDQQGLYTSPYGQAPLRKELAIQQ